MVILAIVSLVITTAISFYLIGRLNRYSEVIVKYKPKVNLTLPRTDEEYSRVQELLDNLIDEVRDDEEHPLADVMELLGNQLELYDDKHYSPIKPSITTQLAIKELEEGKGTVVTNEELNKLWREVK